MLLRQKLSSQDDKQAHSEGEACSDKEDDVIDPLAQCTCKLVPGPMKKIEVLKILGEGSQGTAALCKYAEDLKTNTQRVNGASQKEEDTLDPVFVLKVFEHSKRNEANEVNSVRI